MKRFLLVPLLVVVPLLPIRHAHAGTSSSITVSTTSHGIRLTLEVPRRSYLQDALIDVTVKLENISRETKALMVSCSQPNPEVRVMTVSGAELYPPAVSSDVPALGCGMSFPAQVLSGASLVFHPHIILRSFNVQAAVQLADRWTPGTGTGPVTEVDTKPISLALATGQPPTFTVTTFPNVSVDVHPIAHTKGRLFFQYSSQCFRSDGTGDANLSRFWSAIRGTRIPLFDSPCPRMKFQVVAGYPNQPVATVNYTSP
jgi:hypothetical protein